MAGDLLAPSCRRAVRPVLSEAGTCTMQVTLRRTTAHGSRLCTGKTSESAEALSREDVSEGPVLHPALCRLRVFKATSIIHCTEESMESKYSVFRMHESYYIRAALVMF